MTSRSKKTLIWAVEETSDSEDERITIEFNTIGRGTVHRRRSSARSHRCQPATTLVHTTRRGSDTYLEILPDLTQGVDEEETWEKLQEIRSQAVSMEEKRQLKRQLQAAPTLRTRGLAALKLSRRKMASQMKNRLREIVSKVELWYGSLRYVEGNFGTGLVAFFTFIKWLLYLNIFTFILIAVFILVPQIVFKHPEDPCSMVESNSTSGYINETQCCSQRYEISVTEPERQTDKPLLVQLFLDGLQGTGVLEISYLFYGYYPRHILTIEGGEGLKYNLPLAYLLVVVVILVMSLILMVREAARGLRESLRSSEGQFYQYCNLIFGGWDYCIENNRAATFKKKAIYNELYNHIEAVRHKEEKEQRTKKERCWLYFMRLVINLIVFLILFGSFALIYFSTSHALTSLRPIPAPELATISHGALKHEEELLEEEGSAAPWLEDLIYEYMPSATIVTLNIVVPFMLKALVQYERYTPNFILSITLVRTVFLRLASLVVLLVSIYQRIYACPLRTDDECRQSSCENEPPCWETYVGQQLYKLAILDLVVMFLTTFFVNFPRRCIGQKIMRGSRIGSVIGDIEFEIPKHVLDIVYGQTLCWLGIFFSPLLPAITCVKLVLVFYIKYFDCKYNSSQSSQLYRTSRSNALFITILLLSFIVTIFPVGFSIAEIKPSVSCGPFKELTTVWSEMVVVISESPKWLQSILFFMGTAGFAVPAIILLILAWYYYYAVAAANKHMVELLKNQLVLEGHDKQFLLTRLAQMMKKSEEETQARDETDANFSNDQTLEA
ncbi:transmembrane channel-like protein 7 isoform X2 [Oratosquilla oratoria]|uniref:transmembrane channel-like protein 7 isoform X2 n=1 Tax=Oratosquilla oratoria TaxID=337810 RepID=UPI003F76A117